MASEAVSQARRTNGRRIEGGRGACAGDSKRLKLEVGRFLHSVAPREPLLRVRADRPALPGFRPRPVTRKPQSNRFLFCDV
jgi:hypothetical protein